MSPTPLLLAVDCATRSASVALTRDDQILAVRSADSPRHHAESLLVEIDAALREAGIELADVEAFAVSIGPGTFSSLRIGLATVKGLAFASGRPVAAISTLAAIAHGAPQEHAHVAALLDARRGEVYAGEFDRTGKLPREIGKEAVETVASLAARLAPGARLLGELPPNWAEQLAAAGRPDLRPLSALELGDLSQARALAVASLGRAALAAGRGVDPATLAPRYLQRPEAEEKRLAALGESGKSLDTREKLQ